MDKKILLIGQADDATIAKWKTQAGTGIYAIEVGGHIAYFRRPTRHDVNAALAEASDELPLQGIEEFGKLCFMGGSEDVLKDDTLFLAARFSLKDVLISSDISAKLVNL